MKEWLALQKKLHRRVRSELDRSLPPLPKSLQNYAQAYRRDFKEVKLADEQRFLFFLDRTEILLVGDFHCLSQSQKLLLRLLRLPSVKKPQHLAFEVLSEDDVKAVRRYLKKPSSLSENKLKEQLQLEEVWGSSWAVYKEIFLECHRQKIEIIGLKSPHPQLKKRDEAAAQRLSQTEGRIWILFGEFHCARSHLPQQLKKRAPLKSIGVLQQNEDRLLEEYLEDFSKRSPIFLRSAPKNGIELFCILHTPRWVKWQSYLDQQIRREEQESPIDALEQVRWSLKTLVEFLEDVRYPKAISEDELLDLSVIEAEDEDFASSLKSLPKQKQTKTIQSLEWTRVAALDADKRIYVTEKTVNACAHAAALYLYQSWTDQSFPYRNFHEAILTECVCFFLTKILNHSRRTKHWAELKRSSNPAARLALKSQDLVSGLRRFHKISSARDPHLIPAGILIGRILADRLFEAFLAGEFSKARLNRLLTHAPKNQLETFERLIEIQSVGRAFHPPAVL